MWKIHLVTIVACVLIIKHGQCQMPGMGGMGFGGMGGMGGMSGMMAMQGEIPPRDYMLLDSAIKQIVGPAASPTPAIVAVALRQGGPPTTPFHMMEYTPHFMMLAQQHDVKPPGVKGRPTAQQLQNYIMARSNQWMQTNLGYQAMNIDPALGMMTNPVTNPVTNSVAPAPATAPASGASPTAPQTAPVTPYVAPTPMLGMGGMGGMGNMMNLMALGGFEGFGGLMFDGLF